MKITKTRSTTLFGAMIVAAFLFVSITIGIVVHTASAIDTDSSATHAGHIVIIHDDDEQKDILTTTATVGGALKEAGISIDKNDAVEPDVTQKIDANDFQVNIYRARPVLVVDGSIRERVVTPYQTATQIAADAGITLYPEDLTNLTQSSDIVADGAGLVLTITPATPLTLVLYGSPTPIRTQAKTVGELLKDEGIVLGPNDTISATDDTPITDGMTIQLWHNGEQTINVQEVVPFDTQTIEDANQPVGYTQITTPGVNGSKTVTYEIDMQNGQEVSRTQIQSVVTTPSTPQVEVIGVEVPTGAGYSSDQADIMAAAGVASSDYQYAAYIIDHENGLWCPTRWQGESGCPLVYVALYPDTSQIGYGLCQSTPPIKMASAGADWQTNPVTQMEWCSSYAISRYGSWYGAYTHWVANHNW